MKGFLGNFPITLLCAHGEHIQLCQTCASDRFTRAMTVCPHGGSLLACRLCNKQDERFYNIDISPHRYDKGNTYEGECTHVNERKLLEKK